MVDPLWITMYFYKDSWSGDRYFVAIIMPSSVPESKRAHIKEVVRVLLNTAEKWENRVWGQLFVFEAGGSISISMWKMCFQKVHADLAYSRIREILESE